VIIDGTLIPIDRIAVDQPFCSGKRKRHGVNLQVIASPDGTILWVSGELPGSAHDTELRDHSRMKKPHYLESAPSQRVHTAAPVDGVADITAA
jgi:hypothetical protein